MKKRFNFRKGNGGKSPKLSKIGIPIHTPPKKKAMAPLGNSQPYLRPMIRPPNPCVFSEALQCFFSGSLKNGSFHKGDTAIWKPSCWAFTGAPAKTSDIYTWYYHETLRNDRGDTKNDDFWYTCLPDFIANIKSSGTMRDTQKTMTISATSFRGCNRFSPLLICFHDIIFWVCKL